MHCEEIQKQLKKSPTIDIDVWLQKNKKYLQTVYKNLNN
jgi:hypothetical protein